MDKQILQWKPMENIASKVCLVLILEISSTMQLMALSMHPPPCPKDPLRVKLHEEIGRAGVMGRPMC
jgi:hypothetical protein